MSILQSTTVYFIPLFYYTQQIVVIFVFVFEFGKESLFIVKEGWGLEDDKGNGIKFVNSL